MSFNQNSGYGQALLNAVHSAIPTFGRVFVVANASDYADERFQRMKEVFSPKSGVTRFYTSPETALANMQNEDVMVLDGDTSFTLTAMMTLSTSRVHIVGLDWLMGVKRPYGQSTKLILPVTTAATDIGVVKNTGVRNSIRGVKLISNNTVAQSIYGLVDGGEYLYVEDTEIYKSTDLDVTGAAELVMNGDSAILKNCTIGSLADANSGDIIRANVLLTKELAGTGKVARDVTFENCNFWKKASHVNNRFVYGANADDVERLVRFKDCEFHATKLSGAVPAQAIASGSSLTAGYIVAKDCNAINCTKLSTTTGVIVSGAAYSNATGISVNAA